MWRLVALRSARCGLAPGRGVLLSCGAGRGGAPVGTPVFLRSLSGKAGENAVFSQSPWQHGQGERRGSLLTRYGRDLTEEARAGRLDPVVGREGVIRRTLEVLLRRTKNNPLLVGEPGVGKTAVAEGIAQLLASRRAPAPLRGLQVVSLDLGALVAGTHLRGSFEERLQGVLKEVEDAAGRVVLFIDEFHLLVNAGASSGSMDAANLLKPALARGRLRCIGATTLAEYRKILQPDAALARRLQPVLVPPPSMEMSVRCLQALLPGLEAHHGVSVTEQAVTAAVVGAYRYIYDRRLPDSAVDLLDEASARVQLREARTAAGRGRARETDPSPGAPGGTLVGAGSRGAGAAAVHAATQPGPGGRSKEEEAALLQWFGSVPKRPKPGIEGHRQTAAERKKTWERLWGAGRYEYEAGGGKGREDQPGPRPAPNSPPPTAAPAPPPTAAGATTRPEVAEEDVLSVISDWTGVPVNSVAASERRRLLDLESTLGAAVVGQDAAVRAVSNALRMGRLGLRPERRPTGSLLFLGGPGVGKTASCRALAEAMFGDPGALTRLDMSEYGESASVSRLLGAPPGYVGYQEGGTLTNAVRQRPYSLVVFDEMEKAHREVSNLLLQVLDEGTLTDTHGNRADFSSSVIVLTSNVGKDATTQKEAEDAAAKAFAPEVLNRLDEIVWFSPLDLGDMRKVVALQLAEAEALVREKGVHLDLSDAAADALARAGAEAGGGARPLRRMLRREVLAPMASLLLSGSIAPAAPGSLRVVAIDAPAPSATPATESDGLGLTLTPAGEVLDANAARTTGGKLGEEEDDLLGDLFAHEQDGELAAMGEDGEGGGHGLLLQGGDGDGTAGSPGGRDAYEKHIAQSHKWGPGADGAGEGEGGDVKVLWGGKREEARIEALRRLRERASK